MSGMTEEELLRHLDIRFVFWSCHEHPQGHVRRKRNGTPVCCECEDIKMRNRLLERIGDGS